MKILLIYTNKDRHLAPPPIGLAMIADSVAASHEVKFLDFMFTPEPEQTALRLIGEFQPEVIGLSIRDLDNQDSRNPQNPIAELKPFVLQVRQISTAFIVLGGTAFTTFPAEMLEFLGADYGLAGQGEKVFPRLIADLQAGAVDEHLPGLVSRQDDRIQLNPPLLEGYPECFTPQRSYYDPRPYSKTYWPGLVLIKTGCPFPCIYCDPHVTAGRRFRFRDPAVIVAELEYQVQRHHTRVFHLSDPCFNVPLDHAKSVLEAIIRSQLRIVCMTTLRPDPVDEELFSLMKRAGNLFVTVGADTLSPTMLARYQKNVTLDQVEQCCHLLEKHGIYYMVECLFGGPGETEQTLQESLAFLHKIKPTLTILNAGLRILPGTDLYQVALAEGLVHGRSELLLSKYYFAKTISRDVLYQQIDAYHRRYGYRNARMALMLLHRQMRLRFGQGH